MRFSLIQYFAIDEYGLVYRKVGKDKVVSKYKLSGMLLEDD